MPRNAKRGKRKDTAKRIKWRKSVKRHARNVPQQQQPLQQRIPQQPQVRNSTITFDQYVYRHSSISAVSISVIFD